MVVRLLSVTQATSWTEPKSRVGPAWGSVLKHPFPSRTGQGNCVLVLGSSLDYPLLLTLWRYISGRCGKHNIGTKRPLVSVVTQRLTYCINVQRYQDNTLVSCSLLL